MSNTFVSSISLSKYRGEKMLWNHTHLGWCFVSIAQTQSGQHYSSNISHLKLFFHCFRFDMDMPIYVNLVRDPVERVISWYYYVRAPWYFVERKRAFPELPLPNPNWLRKVRQLTNGGIFQKKPSNLYPFSNFQKYITYRYISVAIHNMVNLIMK